MKKNGKKIAYVINHPAFFCSHIMPHALHAKKNNFVVKLFCGNTPSSSMQKEALYLLKKKKINVSFFKFDSSSLNIVNSFFAFAKMFKTIKKYNPDIIHVATAKGQLFGGLIARILKTKSLVIFISGMGYLFSNKLNFLEKIFKFFFILIQKYIFLHPNKKIIVENRDDYFFFINKFKISKKNLIIFNGSGVNLSIFKKINAKQNKTVLFIGRVLIEKGIYEFLEMSEVLKKKYQDWKFVVAGAIDYKKPSMLSIDEINSKYLNVEFLGHQTNMLEILKKTAIVCLPSYREGFPKALCEASASGLPIVTTNVVGCKDAIIPNHTGLLCKAKNVNSLAEKIEILIKNPKLRAKYGLNGYMHARLHFDINFISKQLLNIYYKLLYEKK